ncbi:MAG: hypothetical protein ACOYJX_04560 [Acutalibacteraceae bacterium]
MSNTDGIGFEKSQIVVSRSIADCCRRVGFGNTVDGNRGVRARTNRNGVVLQIDIEGNIRIVTRYALFCRPGAIKTEVVDRVFVKTTACSHNFSFPT